MTTDTLAELESRLENGARMLFAHPDDSGTDRRDMADTSEEYQRWMALFLRLNAEYICRVELEDEHE